MAAPYRVSVRSRSRSPRTLEAIEQASIGERFQTFDGNRAAGAILRQTFQSLAVSGWNRDVCVHAKSVDAGATRTGENVHAFRIDLICVTSHTRTGTAHSATHGGGVQSGQPRLIPRQRIGFFGIAVGSQAPPLKKSSYPPGQ